MKKKNNQLFIPLIGGIVCGITICAALRRDIKIASYLCKTPKVQGKVRLAFIADLHSCDYGQEKNELLLKIQSLRPDAVLLGGDIFDLRLDYDNSWQILSTLSILYPCVFISGNHERASAAYPQIQEKLSELGIANLKGDCICLKIGNERLTIGGLEDRGVGTVEYLRQFIKCRENLTNDTFNILLSHQPELNHLFDFSDFDLILCGHTHGGQWRIPGVINGIYTPSQGLFPKYAGGLYSIGDTAMIISRGLAKETTFVPRIFNRPELVIVDIIPEK